MMEWVRAMCGSPKGKRKKKKDKLKNTDANPDIRTEMISDESKETKDCPPSWVSSCSMAQKMPIH